MRFRAIPQYIIFCFILLLVSPNLARSQGLVLTDCQGFTRALQTVKSGELNSVKVAISDASGNPLNGARVTLTNSLTGEVTSSISENGYAVFESISEGTFSIGTTATGASVGSISITGAGLGTVAAVGAAAGTTAVGGGTAVAVGYTVDNKVNNSSSSSSNSGSGEGSSTGSNDGGGGNSPTPEPTTTATPTPPPATPRPTPACNDCDPDATPPPLDPDDFFKNNQMQTQKRQKNNQSSIVFGNHQPVSPHT